MSTDGTDAATAAAPTPSGDLVSVQDLVVEYTTDRYVVRPLDGFSLQVASGSLVALLGPSGSGKTTLLSVLSGMVPATSGSVTIDGVDVLGLKGAALDHYRRSTIGIVFQGFNLIPSLTARENVAAPLLVAGMKRAEALARADTLLDEVGLADRAGHRPAKLSGGQQQRVAVARGLVGDPRVLLADEPTANLDHISAEAVVDLLRRLRDRGRTILISTHDDRLLPAVDDVVRMGPARDEDGHTGPLAERRLAPGDVLFRQGDASDHVYEIRSGQVEVVRELADGSEEILARRETGAYIGELGPLLGFPRSATVRALGEAVLRPYTLAGFRERRQTAAVGSGNGTAGGGTDS